MNIHHSYFLKQINFKFQEVLVPLYSLGVLIFLKMLVPNPNFPEVRTPGQILRMEQDPFTENYSVAVVAEWPYTNGTTVSSTLLFVIDVVDQV